MQTPSPVPGLDRVRAIYTLLGNPAVLLPIPTGVKKPHPSLTGWTSFTLQKMEDHDYLKLFNNGSNIGVCLGAQSNGLCTIDIDDDRFVEPFLEANPVFRTTLRTKRLKGCNFWFWTEGEYPGVKGFHHARLHNEKGKPLALGEWRGTGCQTVIEGEADGLPYQRVVDTHPIRFPFADIIWPDWILDPPILEKPFQYESKSGHNLDPDKLENYHPYANGVIKCACPACRENGEDKSGNHLQIKPDGRFGCCKYPDDREHRKLIWKLAGKPVPKSDPDDPFNSLPTSPPTPEPLTFLRFSQILELRRNDNDQILGDHLLDKGNPLVLAGQGGTGKSRLLFQFLAACKMNYDTFLTFPLHPGCRDMKWLVIQSENSPWRLQDEARKYQKIMGEDAWSAFDSDIFVLTPLAEQDTLLALSDPTTLQRIQAALDQFKPDGVICDPLGDFSTGDLNKDVDMRETILTLSRTVKSGNPNRALIIAHHALTGQAGAARAVGYDRSSFARNSKVLFNWTRAQINIAPMNESSNDQLSISCGKCSDGPEFPPFAVRLNTTTMLYECDPNVDVASWAHTIKAGSKGSPLITPASVRQLCDITGSSKPSLAKAIIDDCGCSKASAYRHILSAVSASQIRWSDSRKLYFRN